jgi:hypothetical protein
MAMLKAFVVSDLNATSQLLPVATSGFVLALPVVYAVDGAHSSQVDGLSVVTPESVTKLWTQAARMLSSTLALDDDVRTRDTRRFSAVVGRLSAVA